MHKYNVLFALVVLVSCSEDGTDAESVSDPGFETGGVVCPRFPELEVTVFQDGKTMIGDVEFSHRQLGAVAEQFSKEHAHARLRLTASGSVSNERISEVIKVCGEFGITDVLFNSYLSPPAGPITPSSSSADRAVSE